MNLPDLVKSKVFNSIARLHFVDPFEDKLWWLNMGQWPAWLAVGAPPVMLGSSLILWAISLSFININYISDVGLFTALPWMSFVALSLLCLSFSLTIHHRQTSTLLLLLHVIMLIVIIHGTLPLIYDAPRYSWTYKHIGVTRYIQINGKVDPTIDIYHNWPAFFALTALFTEMAGLESPLSYAIWAQLFFNLIYLGVVLVIFKTITTDRRLIWLSVWFFFLTNWVAQDYYAPQAYAYFFHLLAFSICLTWFRVTTPPAESTIRRWVIFKPLVALIHHILFRAITAQAQISETRDLKQYIGVGLILLLSLGTIVSGHQLTPYMTLISLITIVVVRNCRVYILPLVMLILIITWGSYGAKMFLENSKMWYEALFDFSNVGANVHDVSQISTGQFFVIMVARISSVGVWLLAFVGIIRRIHAGYWDVPIVALAVTPFPMILMQSYGGEMIYRIYLFSLPWMVFFNAAIFYPRPDAGTSYRAALLNILLSGAFLACLQFSYYGQERMNQLNQNEVIAAQHLYQTAPAGSLFLSVTWNFPSLFVGDYDKFVHHHIFEIKEYGHREVPLKSDAIAKEMVDMMKSSKSPAGYFILSRSQRNHNYLRGIFPPFSLEAIEQTIVYSKKFKLVYENADVKIFQFIGSQN